MRGAVVLIVDDLKLFLEIEKGFLVRAGFEVLTAEDGEKAVELARARAPNLILIDYNMPGLDGAATCASMRRDPKLALTPIIIMSARATAESRERSLQAGCTEYVSRPEKPDELLGLVARILASRRRRSTRITVVFAHSDSQSRRQRIGMATDLSGTGLLLVTGMLLEAGAILDLEFVVPKSEQVVKVKGKVMRVKEPLQGSFETGVHFLEVSQGDQETILEFVTG